MVPNMCRSPTRPRLLHHHQPSEAFQHYPMVNSWRIPLSRWIPLFSGWIPLLIPLLKLVGGIPTPHVPNHQAENHQPQGGFSPSDPHLLPRRLRRVLRRLWRRRLRLAALAGGDSQATGLARRSWQNEGKGHGKTWIHLDDLGLPKGTKSWRDL